MLKRMEEGKESGKLFHQLFNITLIIKGVYGVVEIFLGIIILFFTRHLITDLILYLVQGELIDDPNNWIANHVLALSSAITSSTELFVGIYFLVGGVIKMVFIIGLLMKRAWAYPTAMIFMALFVLYELYRLTHTHSLALLFFTVLDILTIYLIWHEYKSGKKVITP